MKIDDDARLYIYWDAVLTFDPTGTTVVLEMDGSERAMTWLGSAVQSGSTWTQTARTNMRFCGTNATATGSDVPLTAGSHAGQYLIATSDGQRVPGPTERFDVS